MGNNMCPYAVVIGGRYTYFIGNHYKFVENNKTEQGTLVNVTNDSLDPFDQHLEKCDGDSFKTIGRSLIHTYWPFEEGGDLVEEDEDDNDLIVGDEDGDLEVTNFCNGNNQMIKIFNQNGCYML